MFLKRLFIKIIGEFRYAKKKGLRVGKNVSVMGGVNFGSEPYLITISDNVRISYDVCFITHDGGTFSFRYKEKYKNVTSFGKIFVGSHTFIGARAIIMPGVRIGSNCVIGAGSIVTKSIPDNSIVVGIPGKIIGTCDEYAERKLNSMPNDWDAQQYKANKKKYLEDNIPEPF